MSAHARLTRFTAGILTFFFLTGCETTAPRESPSLGRAEVKTQMGSGEKNLPAPSADVKKIQAWSDASKIAERSPGREALVGGGRSMNPVYGENTMLVVHPIDYQKLTPGMTVVYMNREGRRVAHQLIAKEKNGWRARGLNNAEDDPELVTAENLIGVVYASLVHTDS